MSVRKVTKTVITGLMSVTGFCYLHYAQGGKLYIHTKSQGIQIFVEYLPKCHKKKFQTNKDWKF